MGSTTAGGGGVVMARFVQGFSGQIFHCKGPGKKWYNVEQPRWLKFPQSQFHKNSKRKIFLFPREDILLEYWPMFYTLHCSIILRIKWKFPAWLLNLKLKKRIVDLNNREAICSRWFSWDLRSRTGTRAQKYLEPIVPSPSVLGPWQENSLKSFVDLAL